MTRKTQWSHVRRFAVTAILFLAVTGAVWSADEESPAENRLAAADIALIGELYRLVETLGAAAWPGFERTDSPVLYIRGERQFAVGFPAPLEGYEPVPEMTVAGRAVQVAPRTLPAGLAASFPVQGVHAAVLGTPAVLELSPPQWVLKAAHEMFHVFQYRHDWIDKVASLEIGPRDQADWQLNFPFPYKDADVASLMHLVSYPTWLAIEAPTAADAVYNAGVAAEARAVLQGVLRSKTGDEKAWRYLLFQEATEGVAKYVERRMAAAAAAGGEPAAAFSALPGCVPYGTVWADDYAGQTFLVKHAGRVAKSRTEFYHLGLGKCLLLDRLDPAWKARYFEMGLWLPDLLDQAVRLQRQSCR
jgi:hypothetical protein